jgi:hypothetical protein
MLPIQCKGCGHIQDAGSASVPNELCERCGLPIYGHRAHNPVTVAVLSVLAFVASCFIGMPSTFLWLEGILSLFLVCHAWVKFRKGFPGQKVRCAKCSRPMIYVAGGGPGFLAIGHNERDAGIGGAERCMACGRMWCVTCYPDIPRNSCPCGRRRNSREFVGGALYVGPVRLVKVLYSRHG